MLHQAFYPYILQIMALNMLDIIVNCKVLNILYFGGGTPNLQEYW